MSNRTVNGSIADLTSQYRCGRLSPVKVVQRELNKIKTMDRRVNPIVFMFDETDILKQAKASAARYKKGETLGPFDGVPISYKDDAQIRGYRSTMGSFFLATRAFEFMGLGGDAPDVSEGCIKMFEDSGAIPLCITTTPEMCCTDGCATYLHGVTRNPHNLMKTPGGSSGGAGAITALNIGYINMGSDMGGSIRIPAANNGCFGLKPSYSIGACGDTPIFPYFGVNGPLSQNVDNIILYMQQLQERTGGLKGVDLSDDNLKNVGSIRDLRIAVTKDLAGTVDYVDPDVRNGVLKVVKQLKKLGATVEFAEPAINTLPARANSMMITLIGIEYANYAKKVREYKGGKYEKLVVPFVMKACDQGAKVTTEEVKNAMLNCDELRFMMNQFFKQNKYDLLLMPSTPIPPRDTLGYHDEGYIIDRVDGKRKTLSECYHASTAFTSLTSVSQQPAIVIPTGYVNDRELNQGKLPISAQFVAPLDRDDLVLKVAYALQNKFDFIP
eukprot:178078_1